MPRRASTSRPSDAWAVLTIRLAGIVLVALGVVTRFTSAPADFLLLVGAP
ncbi:MAG: hypothetical protein ACTHZX_05235 [Microbacterium sp.]